MFYIGNQEIKKIYAQESFKDMLNCCMKLSELYTLLMYNKIDEREIDKFCELSKEERERTGNTGIEEMVKNINEKVKKENLRKSSRSKHPYYFYAISIEDTSFIN